MLAWKSGMISFPCTPMLVVTPLSVVNLAGIASQLALRTVTGKGR